MQPNEAAATRRRVLLGLGTGVAVAVAGCTSTGATGGRATTHETTGTDSTTTESGTESTTDEETTTESTTDEETTTEESGSARVRVAHMAPNAPNVDVWVDGSPALSDCPFGAVSSYLAVPAGERQVTITVAGDADAVVFDGAVPVSDGADYTIAATGEVGDDADQPFAPLVLEDDRSAPAGGESRVRVVHASPDAPAVDVTVASTGDAIFDGVAYGETDTVTVPAGEYTLQIRGDTDGNDGDVAAEFDVTLNGGQVYTAFAAGYLTPDDEPADTPFDLLVACDTENDD